MLFTSFIVRISPPTISATPHPALTYVFRYTTSSDHVVPHNKHSQAGYVLGGVEVLYEKLVDGSTDSAEYINRMYDFAEEFNERFNEGITSKDILDLCRANAE